MPVTPTFGHGGHGASRVISGGAWLTKRTLGPCDTGRAEGSFGKAGWVAQAWQLKDDTRTKGIASQLKRLACQWRLLRSVRLPSCGWSSCRVRYSFQTSYLLPLGCVLHGISSSADRKCLSRAKIRPAHADPHCLIMRIESDISDGDKAESTLKPITRQGP